MELEKIRDELLLTEENLACLRAFRPIDDTFMRRLFRDNKALAQLVLRIIMKKPDLIVEQLEVQTDLKMVTGARSLVLDAYAADQAGVKYDIEVQRDAGKAGPARATYHAAMLVADNLKKGEDFEKLPQMVTVFITEKDYYGEGCARYPVEWTVEPSGQLFGSPSHIIYVNGSYRDDSDIGWLMHDFCCADPDEMHYAEMAESTRYYKENPKEVRDMCELMEKRLSEREKKGVEKGLAQGMEKGLMQGIISTLAALVKEGDISLKKAAEKAGLSVEEFTKQARQMNLL